MGIPSMKIVTLDDSEMVHGVKKGWNGAIY
jgi:hypothetical protein